jgi:hypothetical protein
MNSDRRNRYKNLTEEQKEKRRQVQREWIRKKRAAQKAAKAPSIPPAALVPATAPTTSATPQTKPQSTPAKSIKPIEKEISPQKARQLHRVWRAQVRDQILDFLTSGQCSLTGRDYESNRIYGLFFGIFDRLTQLEKVADNEDQLAELRLTVAIEALRRLSGEAPARGAPALVIPVTR